MQQHVWENTRKQKKKKPEVSVRISVRPLRPNWKPVKIVEVDESAKTCSPVQDQLDAKVWKTKKVRTEFVEEEQYKKKPELISECSCHNESSPKRVPGLVLSCDCPNCEGAAACCSSMEQFSKRRERPESKDDIHVEKMKKETKKKSKKKTRRHRSVSTVPPTPPNTVISQESPPKWNKLYEEKPHPVKPIDMKKIAAVPGQIGMSELQPEKEEEHPQRSPTIHLAPPTTPNFFHPSPKTLIPPAISPASSLSLPSVKNDGLPPHRSPPNVKPPPFEHPPGIVTSMVNKVIGKKEDTPAAPKIDVPEVAPITEPPVPSPRTFSSASVDLLSPLPPATPSAFRRMEQLFYGSESSWWIFVLFVMMTIFAYRTSIEQHTCYYD